MRYVVRMETAALPCAAMASARIHVSGLEQGGDFHLECI